VNLARFVRLLVRESRGSRGRLVFFAVCLAAGVAGVVSVAGLSAGLAQGIRMQGRQLLGADMVVASRRELPPAVDAFFALHADTRRTDVIEMTTLVARPQAGGVPGASELVQLKVVAGEFPLYGKLVLDPPGTLLQALTPDTTAVASDLLSRLGLRVGDELRIGQAQFTIAAAVTAEPEAIASIFTLGPHVFVSPEGLERSELRKFGSIVRHRALFRLAGDVSADEVRALEVALEDSLPDNERISIDTYPDAQPELRRGLARVGSYLGLVALLSLLIGGVGVAQTVRAWLGSRFDAIAVLKCLGVRPREIVALYAVETALLGFTGSLAGVAIATVLLSIAPRFLTGLLPAMQIDAWQPAAAFRGLALGTGVALLFSVAPLSSLRLVPPLRVLRRDAEPLASSPFARAIVVFALLGGVFGAAYVQSGSVRIAAGFAAGMTVAAAVLAGAARLLTRAVAGIARERVRVTLRHGLSALARPGAGTLPAVTALGLGVLVVVAIALVDRGLTSRLRADLPKNAPNIFLVDMQSSQWPRVRTILEDAGATEIRGVPIINARLVSIDGVGTSELAKKGQDEGRRKWILTREQNLTYLDELPKDNVVVEGKLWSDPEHPEISIERDYAKDMGAHLGSKLVYDVQGVPLELTVTSIRTVDWKSFGINFFLVVEPGVLDKAPQMRVAAARMPAGSEQALQDRLAAELPNVTLLKVREIVEKIATIMERLGVGIRLLGGFAIAAGIAILAGAVGASASRRGREVALLKTLGATRRGVVTIFAVEFALTGLVAGVVGTIGGGVLAWVVLTRGMEIAWTWRPLVLAGAPVATVALSVIAGIAASAGALRRRPIEVLRGE
jgi:putative ABC transport system permease protein